MVEFLEFLRLMSRIGVGISVVALVIAVIVFILQVLRSL